MTTAVSRLALALDRNIRAGPPVGHRLMRASPTSPATRSTRPCRW